MPNQNNQTHISDQELQLVISDQPTETPHREIETHVAECPHCQDRLLDFAAEQTWRDEFSRSIIALQQQAAFDQTDTRGFESNRGTDCSSFDLKTIDLMLEGILESPTHPETLGRLGRYEVEKVIGVGGMGIVFRGFDRELHRPVAIKMISPQLLNNGTAKERFLREAKAAGALLHPNVIAIHDISESNGVPWFVMPLVVGPTLQEVVNKQGPLPAKEVVRIGKQIAAGLAAAHQQGLVHRDIKPANILVDNQVNRIVVTDFGLVRREAEESMTQTEMVAGTPNYMSPEQSRGEDVDARSDLFSLGSLLFFLATGVTPFKSSAPMGVVHKIGHTKHTSAQSLNPDVPSQLAKMIDRLLEKRPIDRFQSASEVEAWLERFLAHMNQPVQTRMPSLPRRPSRSRLNSSIVKPALAVLATSVLCGAVFYVGTIFGTRNSPTATMTFADVQNKHRISTESTFESELMSLTQRVKKLSNPNHAEIIDPCEPFSSPFDGQLKQLDQAVKRLSRELGDD